MRMYKNDWRFHNKRKFRAFKTKNGRLALWERGGVTKFGGTATLLATPLGRKPKAMMITMYNNINGKHALIQVNKGTIISREKLNTAKSIFSYMWFNACIFAIRLLKLSALTSAITAIGNIL